MAKLRGNRIAFGKPGIEPRWTQGDKDGIGTAYATSSRTWFTLWNGVVTEAYYPTIDRPQVRDLQAASVRLEDVVRHQAVDRNQNHTRLTAIFGGKWRKRGNERSQ